MKKIVLTGGGTAGHITPHLALLPYLKENFVCEYIGSKNGMEKGIMEKLMPYHEITTCKLKRKLDLSNLLIPFKLVKGIIDAKKLLKQIKPDIIFSKGGFVAVPVVLAASMLKIPVITHESDYSLGLANKIIKNKCKYVCVSFEDTLKELKNGVYTGSPIRKEIFEGKKENITKLFDYDITKKTIMFIGGSLGSKTINDYVFETIKTLTNKYNVIHIVGKNNKNDKVKAKNYLQLEFISDVQDCFNLADVIITRGGANVLFELLAIKKPMVIIPLGLSESRGDQILNANYFKRNGFANMILEENLSPQSLTKEIDKTFNESEKLISNMNSKSKNGTKIIADLINKTAK